ncbi:hypothetical protein K461DRAFT_323350 [Myriangium duriaei CBS 260.36]|uniref:RING-type E3 ubiquitin transferase n=1 Tax=Myriangium duriaei CBS 260.36 TaxID=1168546 RepID=A0A9P4IZS1_9PEZI|nr:hypothetical protein K461DRAFT_323350 [Myriangium duriaei CBS 260.36]
MTSMEGDAGAPTPPQGPAQTNNRGSRGRGRGNRGGGGGGGGGGGEGRRSRGGGERRGDQRGGRGRGAGGRGSASNLDGQTASRPAALAAPVQTAADGATNAPEDEDVEAEVCFICASPVVHNCVAPCNHRTCHICALRLRALYKSKACAHCRTNAEVVIFTDDANKRFEDFVADDFSMQDSNLGINYEKQEIFEDTVLLLRYNCPDSSCDVACLGWPDLHRHVKSVHHKVMCDLCTRNKKVFTHEHELFTPQELKKHEKFGDDNPGAVDQSGFKGHPECGFCRQRFYGDDELYAHCRDRHERCHICDRRNGGRQPQYYVDYNALEVHFRKDHFMCPDQECLEKKFVVFDSEMDLKAHQLEAHPNGLTKDARRDARRVDISGFDYRAPHQQEQRPRREGREGRGRGRGRDPNAEPLPPSSAQPLRRDELAYQRQMAIQSAQSVTSRTFGGQLSQPETYAARPPPNAQEPSTVTAHAPSRPDNLAVAVDSLSLDSTPTASLSPQDQARRMRHNAVTERAAVLLKNDSNKLSDFRSKVSAYQSGTLNAQGLIEFFFSLFDTSSSELGKMVKELADIFEQPKKRDDLLRSWSDWKAINEDYPSLPGPGSAGPLQSGSSSVKTWASNLAAPNITIHTNNSTKASGSRVLRLKSSTAQSGRTAASRSLTSGTPFPPLAASSASSNPSFPALSTTQVPSSKSRPAWFASIPTGATSSTSSKILSAPSSGSASPALKPQRAPPAQTRDMFPALPPGKKPTSTVFSPGYSGAGVKRFNSPASGGSPWGAPAAGATATAEAGVEEEGGGGKKKGKGKKVLLNWG